VGGRSRVAAQMLAGKGFKQVYNVSGGIKAWQSKTAVGPQTLGMDLFEGRESARDFLVTAYSLEQGLEQFYLDMADKAQNEVVKDLFEKLAAIEVKHKDQVFDRYQNMVDPSISREGFESMITVAALEGGLTTEQYLDLFGPDLSVETEVVSMAMSIEAQALDLYQRVAGQVTDPDARAVVLQIAREENQHLARLGKMMESL
jgi:sulfur-carrier protein adenylyltransferase/sulfurtransferase